MGDHVFNQNKKAATKGHTENEHVGVTIFTAGCEFIGKLYCRGTTRIGGRVEGEIVSEGMLIIEDEANIQANIQAEEVVVLGKVKGKLQARVRVQLCPSSTYEGDISAPSLVIREGAQFNGRSQMLAPAVTEKTAPHVKLANENKGDQKGQGPKISPVDSNKEFVGAVRDVRVQG